MLFTGNKRLSKFNKEFWSLQQYSVLSLGLNITNGKPLQHQTVKHNILFGSGIRKENLPKKCKENKYMFYIKVNTS